MNRIAINQKGVGALELLLIIIIVGMIGGIGWYVFSSLKITNDAYTSASTVSKDSNPKFSKLKSVNSSNKAVPVNNDALITQAVKNYKNNAANASIANVTIKAISGINAYGTIGFTGMDGGGEWLAHEINGVWGVVNQGSVGICKEQIRQYNLPISWESSIC